MQCVVWIVYNFTKQLIVTLLQQLAKFREVGWAEAASLIIHVCDCEVLLCFSSRTWCEHIMVDNEESLRQLEQEKFDIAVVDGIFFARCKYLVAHRLQIPWISYSDGVDPLTVRVPWLPSFVPSYLFPATERMNFVEKLQNAVASFALYFVAPRQYPEPPQEVLDAFRRYGHFDSLNDLVLKSVFWFLPKDTVLDSPRPMMPNMANIGGLTLKRSTEKLPAEIRNFIARAKKGVILMTFGTMASTMPPEMMEKFCSAFRRLQDYGVIWRLNSRDEVILPDNVMVAQWLPQQDILAHKSVRLFITHSGNNGQYEAIYHAVPMIGFPILGDQFYNARRLDYKGYGISMDLCDFTADQLLGNIHKILGNSSYKERVTKASKIFRSQAQSPVEKATFWIEHVCRFGGDHLRSAGNDLPLYSYFMLDVLLFILAILLIVIYLMFMLIGFVLQKCRKQRIVEIAKSKKDK